MEVEADFMKLSIFILFFCFKSIQAAPRKISDELSTQRAIVFQMSAKLNSLEKEIEAKSNLHSNSLNHIKQFEEDIKNYRKKLQELKAQLHQTENEKLAVLKSYLIQSDDEAMEEWQRKVHLELLKTTASKYQAKQNEILNFENKVIDFENRLVLLRKDEEELASVLQDLEARKKLAMEKYLTNVKSKASIEKRILNNQVARKVERIKSQFSSSPIVLKKPEKIFSHPLSDFLSLTSSPKGVTFKYKAIQPVKAVGGGKIVFAGDLASYGQVLMVDHGNDLRTVLLGKLDLKVKKNQTVNEGEILAYTIVDQNQPENLYFEIRKKNTAQNTILWLDSNGASKI